MVQIAEFSRVDVRTRIKKVPFATKKLAMLELFFVSDLRHSMSAHLCDSFV